MKKNTVRAARNRVKLGKLSRRYAVTRRHGSEVAMYFIPRGGGMGVCAAK